MNTAPLDIVLIARDTWSDLWRRRQYLANEFARRGNRVLFVEPPFSLPRLLMRSPETTSRPLNRLAGSFAPPVRAKENLYVCAPIKPVPNHPPPLAALNKAIQARHLKRSMASLGMSRPILWINPEYAVWAADEIPHSLVVYDVTDDWTHASLSQRELAEIERNDRALLKKADLVFTVSPDLLEKKSFFNIGASYIPNGVDFELYSIDSAPRPPEIAHITGPIAGYTGTLHEDRQDISLIEHLSQRGGFTQVFVGPDFMKPENRRRLAALKNVVLVPAQPYHRLPEFVSNFDVCMIPHRVTPFTNSLDPIKAYEYLASGKPIVSVAVDGIKPLAAFIGIAENHGDFHKKITLALEGRSKSSAAERRTAARLNRWQARAEEILSQVKKAIQEKRRD
jgi:teichuronic acid biosynthesis glycosyltransferase TuaH